MCKYVFSVRVWLMTYTTVNKYWPSWHLSDSCKCLGIRAKKSWFENLSFKMCTTMHFKLVLRNEESCYSLVANLIDFSVSSVNPPRPKIDNIQYWYQFSPNIFNIQSRENVMGIDKVIANGIWNCFDLLSNSPNFREMYGNQSREFVCGYWGLKGW